MTGFVFLVFFLTEKLLIWNTTEKDNKKANNLTDRNWLSRLAYMTDIFGELHRLNTDLRGNGGDVFIASPKVKHFKQKVEK